MKQLLFDLCSVGGVSGSEEPIAKFCAEKLSAFADTVIDKNAHLDRIGFIVTSINEKGFVKVASCGGIDVRVLSDAVLVSCSDEPIKGVVCCMPPHLSDGGEDKAAPIDKVWIDFGLPYEKVVEKIKIGDVLTFYGEPKEFMNNKITAPALDDRCGIAALIKCAELISKKELSYKVVILLSVQEETYGTGAKTGAYQIDADEAIAVDVSFASQPDVSGQYAGIELAKGPMICISPILSRVMSDKLISIAKGKNIPFQYEPISGTTGTNADHISVAKSGVASAVVSIPQRYMHTPIEVIDITDVENTAALIAEYIISGGAFND